MSLDGLGFRPYCRLVANHAMLLRLAPYIFSGDKEDRLGRGWSHPTDSAVLAPLDDIVERIRTGDRIAFRTLMQAHYNGLLRFATSLIGDGAEDVVQDVFIRIWEGRDRLDPRRAIRAYLYTAVRRRVFDVQKHERAQRRLSTGVSMIGETAAESPDAELAARIAADDEEVRLAALARAIAALPERSRSALVLRFEQGMTHAEIGTVLGCSDKAAQQVVLRAIAAVRKILLP